MEQKLLLAAALAVAGAFVVAPRAAWAHSWYPPVCCGGYDCEPLPAGAVTLTPLGWLIHETGEVIPTAQALQSEDGKFHRCRLNRANHASLTREAGGTKCLFVPPGGS